MKHNPVRWWKVNGKDVLVPVRDAITKRSYTLCAAAIRAAKKGSTDECALANQVIMDEKRPAEILETVAYVEAGPRPSPYLLRFDNPYRNKELVKFNDAGADISPLIGTAFELLPPRHTLAELASEQHNKRRKASAKRRNGKKARPYHKSIAQMLGLRKA